jgi:hypothetical protein
MRADARDLEELRAIICGFSITDAEHRSQESPTTQRRLSCLASGQYGAWSLSLAPNGFVTFGSRVDGAMARAFLTVVQHWSAAVTYPAC